MKTSRSTVVLPSPTRQRLFSRRETVPGVPYFWPGEGLFRRLWGRAETSGSSIDLPSTRRQISRQGFTLAEIMISMAIFTLVIGGVIVAHLFGLRMYEISKAKLGVSDEARTTLNGFLSEVRSAKLVRIGSGDSTTFNEVTNGATQAGGAIMVYTNSTVTNRFVRYYWDSADKAIKRVSDSNSTPSVIAHSVSNSVVFQAEDFLGNPATNGLGNRVISMNLQFFQVQYPVVPIPGGLFDYYRWRTKVTPRTD